MREEYDHEILYPTKEEILAIHRDIISEDDDAEPGVKNDGHVEFALEYIEHGHFGETPETIHEKAVTLMRLLAANHPFVDGNKRTALNSTWTFYAMNGLYFDYGEEIKAILKLFAVMERMVDQREATEYFEEIALPEDHERVPQQVVQLIHLPTWINNLLGEMDRFSERVDGKTEASDEDVREFVRIVGEMKSLSEAVTRFRDDNEDRLSEDVLQEIRKLEERMENTISTLDEAVKLHERGTDISRIIPGVSKENNLNEEVGRSPSAEAGEDDLDPDTKS